MPMKQEYVCLNCGTHKVGYNTKGKYCSNKCQLEFQTKQKIESDTASHRTIRRYLIETIGNICSKCGIDKWNDKEIILELEHIDGNSENNKLDNVCLLCPNCHSQTDTYKNRNKGNGRHKRRMRYKEGKSY